MELSIELAGRIARIALANLATDWPWHSTHLLRSAADARAPAELHPAFHGSYDWHSCVHMQWSLVRLLRLFPGHELSAASRSALDHRLSQAKLAAEVAYFKERPGFERPYGWAWLLKLGAELRLLAAVDERAAPWSAALAPLETLIAERWLDFLPRADFPVRAGTHGNSAFALLLALDWARLTQHRALARMIESRALRWYGRDRAYPAAYEPGGDDFLAAGMIEAVLMRKVINSCSYSDWWEQFAPPPSIAPWLGQVAVADSRDGKIVHLHGVNLTRAWCWRVLATELPQDEAARAHEAARVQFAASLPAALEGDYVATHWLASFALLALSEAPA